MADYPPCLNPNCKSHGKPHPNCRCYGSFAHGGEVKHFCESNMPHTKDCKYYAEGGEVDNLDMSQEDPTEAVASYMGHSGLHGLLDMAEKSSDKSLENYQRSIKRGQKKMDMKIDHMFSGGKSDKEDHEKAIKSIDEWIDKGGIMHDIQQFQASQSQPAMFAGGGDVQHVQQTSRLDDPHISNAYPSQNVLLQTAKGRMSNYLTGLKPQKNTPKLAFDDEPDTSKQKKSYDRAVKMAVDPLRILDKIKHGTIEPEHIEHLKCLHPEVDQALQKKITEKITHAQLKGEKPSYKVRQGLSLYLGVPLSGEMSPQSIQAAQATFQNKQQQPQGGGGAPKKSTSSLTKSDDAFLTGNQARAARQQKQ